jgi:hypothetical protein
MYFLSFEGNPIAAHTFPMFLLILCVVCCRLVFHNVLLCSHLVDCYHHFRGICYLYFLPEYVHRTFLQNVCDLPGYTTQHHITQGSNVHRISIQCIEPIPPPSPFPSPPPFFLWWSGTEPTITESITGLVYHSWMMDDDECGVVGGMLGKGNGSTQTKLAPVLLCPPQIPHDLTGAPISGPLWLLVANCLSYGTTREPIDSLLCPQESSTGPYPEPDQFSPHHPILSLSDPF